MTQPVARRDYSLTGTETERAADRSLVAAPWFRPRIDAGELQRLSERSNGRAALDTVAWLALLVGSGWLAVATAWSWWSIPAFALYGALYGGASDSRWHECGHGTAFRSRRLNDIVYVVASFMVLRGPTVWRWSHYRHHTDTIVVGRDAEIAFQRPPNLWRNALWFTGWWVIPLMVGRLVRHSMARLDPDAAELVPADDHRRVMWESRAFLAVLGLAAGGSLLAWTPLPIMLVGLPTVYGSWLMVFFGMTQHAGLREDVLDHRLNTRTVYMNPVFRFLYLNMNYHVEHHIFPTVPYRNLPALHRTVGDQLAPAVQGTLPAYRQIWSTLMRQRRDPTYEIPLDLPSPLEGDRPVDAGLDLWHRAADGEVDLGPLRDLVPGQISEVQLNGRPYVLYRLDRGSGTQPVVRLADGECTHQQVRLRDGVVVDGCLECPKHNGRFDADTGRAVGRPVTRDLGTYPVAIRNGRMWVRFDD